MILSTTFDVPVRAIVQSFAIPRSNVVRGDSIVRNMDASFRIPVGGALHQHTKLIPESREQALGRLIETQ